MQAQQTIRTPHSALRTPSPWWRRGGKYAAVLRMSMANHFAYIGEALLRSIFLVLIIFIFVQLWSATYTVLGTSQIGVYSLPQMVWYFAFAEAIIMSAPMLRRKVDEDVKSGDLAYRLSKPYNYMLYLASDYAGEWIARFVLNLAVASALALLLVGPITFTVWGVASALVLLVGAVVLDFLGAAIVSLLAFWIEDTMPFNLIYRRLTMLLGGMMIPLDVFPEPLSSIARALPFSYIVYGPSRQWVSPTESFFVEVLPRLAISIVVAGSIVFLMFRAGQRNVTVNGG
ncbi:MAG TPA: ABC-2 family transporter protein [Chloroflexia bacterium]|nr:ABC-2 family transporter protein [Chloroflexia bacterium]